MPVPGYSSLGSADHLYLGAELEWVDESLPKLLHDTVKRSHLDFLAIPLADPLPPYPQLDGKWWEGKRRKRIVKEEGQYEGTEYDPRPSVDISPAHLTMNGTTLIHPSPPSSSVSSPGSSFSAGSSRSLCTVPLSPFSRVSLPYMSRFPFKYNLIPSTRSELILENQMWSSQVIGVCSSWIQPDLPINNTYPVHSTRLVSTGRRENKEDDQQHHHLEENDVQDAIGNTTTAIHPTKRMWTTTTTTTSDTARMPPLCTTRIPLSTCTTTTRTRNSTTANGVCGDDVYFGSDLPPGILQHFCIDALEQQLGWATHVGVHAVVAPTPLPQAPNYANVLRRFLGNNHATAVWVRIPLVVASNKSGGDLMDQLKEKDVSCMAAGRSDRSIEPPRIHDETISTNSATKTTTGSGQNMVRRKSIDGKVEYESGWYTWNRLRTAADFHQRLGVALELTDFEDGATDFLDRWFAEPVKAVIVPSSLFLSNSRGYPVLSKKHKDFLVELFKYRVLVIIRLSDPKNKYQHSSPSGGHLDSKEDVVVAPKKTLDGLHNNAEEFPELKSASLFSFTPNPLTVDGGLLSSDGGTSISPFISSCSGESVDMYRNYVALLYQSRPPPSIAEQYNHGYLDCLQSPLQPLQDNLESLTYEVFEKDPIKYTTYEQAIKACLVDKMERNGWTCGSSGANELVESGAASASPYPIVIVMGAGRGPLVQAALTAFEELQLFNFQLYAVEKNLNAVHTLNHRVATDTMEGWRRVQVIGGDMRSCHNSALRNIKADIMVSELLGSLGDNELSPECLDGAQRYLKRDGVSIPCKYTSTMEPISCTKLWSEVKNYGEAKGFDTPYVVKLHSVCYVAQEPPQLCFRFEHPNWGDVGAEFADGTHTLCMTKENVRRVPQGVEDQQESGDSRTNKKSVVPGEEDYCSSRRRRRSSSSSRSRTGSSDSDGIHTNGGTTLTATTDGRENSGCGCNEATIGVQKSGNIIKTSSSLSSPGLYLSPSNDHNRRYCELEFTAKCDCLLHGFCGYFDSQLYKHVSISIDPRTFSEGLFSWFPIYFPIREPLYVRRNEPIKLHIWRLDDPIKVWYEWCLSLPVNTPIQNSGGKSYFIGK